MEANDKQVTQLIRSTHWSIFANKNVQFLLKEGQNVKIYSTYIVYNWYFPQGFTNH